MLRGLAVALVLAAPHVAHADERAFWLEAGFSAMVYVPDKIDTTTGMYHLTTTSADHAVAALGTRLRFLVDIDGWHAGAEWELGRIEGPTVDAESLSRDSVQPTTMTMTTHGDVVQAKAVVGRHATWGPLRLSGELAPGLQVARFSPSDQPNYVQPWVQSWWVCEAHGNVDVWLAPKLTLGLQSSIDLAHYERAELALVLGWHTLAFDGER